jgi:hypothetical protein
MQHPADSFLEVLTNTVIAFVISVAAWGWVIGPVFGIKTNFGQDIGIVGLFTVISIIRQYILRRLFNGRSPYAYFKERLS